MSNEMMEERIYRVGYITSDGVICYLHSYDNHNDDAVFYPSDFTFTYKEWKNEETAVKWCNKMQKWCDRNKFVKYNVYVFSIDEDIMVTYPKLGHTNNMI